MQENPSPGRLEISEPRSTVIIGQDPLVVETATDYRGKTNMYVVERTSVLSILDKSARAIQGIWEDDWTEIAPGIETRREEKVFRSTIGSHNSEHAVRQSVRIHSHACPVHIRFSCTEEYIDYEDSRFSSTRSNEYWVRYASALARNDPLVLG